LKISISIKSADISLLWRLLRDKNLSITLKKTVPRADIGPLLDVWSTWLDRTNHTSPGALTRSNQTIMERR
jgi:hypothetical protein